MIEHLLGRAGKRRTGNSDDDAPNHIFETLVDLGHVGAERCLKQRLGTNIVPQRCKCASSCIVSPRLARKPVISSS
jgi:hypothetical protein